MSDESSVGRLIQSFQDALQEVVGFLQLVIEQRVVLGQLEGLKVQFLDHLETQAVQCCEHPAAATLFLVGNFSLLQADGKIKGGLSLGLVIFRGSIYAVSSYCVHSHGIGAVGIKVFFKLFQALHRNCCVHF